MHHYQDLIQIFNNCFASDYNTRLVKGGEEPIYLPAHEHQPENLLYFARGFFSSALHECSHWLIAGAERRTLIDFGYWYEPDGRNSEQQKRFLQAEARPQAMEWILSRAANHPFRLSIDNLNGEELDLTPFKDAVYQQIISYCQTGLAPRASLFRQALCRFYNSPYELTLADFNRTNLI